MRQVITVLAIITFWIGIGTYVHANPGPNKVCKPFGQDRYACEPSNPNEGLDPDGKSENEQTGK